jgi:hypothetical protein|eukprot:SAG25_NODE_1756_length_2391_cov_2.729930_2_plen_92_part_00
MAGAAGVTGGMLAATLGTKLLGAQSYAVRAAAPPLLCRAPSVRALATGDNIISWQAGTVCAQQRLCEYGEAWTVCAGRICRWPTSCARSLG